MTPMKRPSIFCLPMIDSRQFNVLGPIDWNDTDITAKVAAALERGRKVRCHTPPDLTKRRDTSKSDTEQTRLQVCPRPLTHLRVLRWDTDIGTFIHVGPRSRHHCG